nr:DUF1015 domain-containing protein [Desulfobulbaceae bacterium]
MARIAPLCGVRYNTDKIKKMEDVVSPPYDVIDVQSQAALIGKNPYNMINLDLRKSVKVDALADGRYQQASERFNKWLAESVLIQDQQPAMYLYSTDYTTPSGKKFIRKGFISLAGLAEFAEGVVKPHEKTFRGVTTDRLNLIDACKAQFSPIFSLYSDPAGDVMACLEKACDSEPLYSVSDQDGCSHTIWAVTDRLAIEKVQNLFVEKSIYIADGHHRYTTSLQLRELMRQRLGSVEPTSPFDYTMMYFCAMEDEGLSVLPTHRLVRIPYIATVDSLVSRLMESFDVEELMNGSRESLIGEVLGRMEEHASSTMFGFYHTASDRCFLLSLKDGVMEQTCSAKHPKSLQELDVVVLSELVLECSLDLSKDLCEKDGLINYFADPDEALDAAVKETAVDDGCSPVLFLMNSTLVEQVRRIADEGLVMPHKSTYFYPKVLTGLVINKLVGTDTIK